MHIVKTLMILHVVAMTIVMLRNTMLCGLRSHFIRPERVSYTLINCITFTTGVDPNKSSASSVMRENVEKKIVTDWFIVHFSSKSMSPQ